MPRTKADRFERMVRKLTSDDQSCGLTEVLLAEEAIHLLRREHRAVVRAIRKHRAWAADGGCSSYYEEALLDVLDILKRVAR